MTKPALSAVFPGATKASVVVLALFSMFLAALFAIAFVHRMDRSLLMLAGGGAIMMAILALAQLGTLRSQR
ncbi:MAG: hypothetical protein WA840_01865 [Caulobacteraceae bacterium]